MCACCAVLCCACCAVLRGALARASDASACCAALHARRRIRVDPITSPAVCLLARRPIRLPAAHHKLCRPPGQPHLSHAAPPLACTLSRLPQDVPFPDQLRIINSVSILVMVHGSAIALWPFLPPGAVAVHIGPDVQTGRTLQRVWAEHYVSNALAGSTHSPRGLGSVWLAMFGLTCRRGARCAARVLSAVRVHLVGDRPLCLIWNTCS